MTLVSQTDQATNKLEEEANQAGEGLAYEQQDPNGPETPFPTALVLNREQEEAMVDFALRYVDDLETEMDRTSLPAIGGNVPMPNPETFFGKRELYTLRYYNHVADRPLRDKGDSVWKHSNITASLSQRITMQMIARANNFYFATDPWYAIHFVGQEDKPLSERIDRHSKWKFNLTGLKDVMMMATEFAFVRGEAVVKTTHQVRERFYQKRGKALHDQATGLPVLDDKGNFIFGDSKFVDELEPDPNAMALAQQQAMPTGAPMEPAQPVMIPTGRKVLRRAPTIIFPKTPEWKEGLWPMKQRTFEGPEAKLVHYKDFLCPLNAPDIHEAELVCHLYDLPVMTLIEMFRREDLLALGAGEGFNAMKRAVEVLRQLSNPGTDPKSAEKAARTDMGEKENKASQENQLAEVAECYLSYDANGDGIAEEIMLVIDRKNRFPLFYDYVDNVCVKGRRPFEVVRAKPVDGRWYGMGAMEYFQPEQEFIDLMVNRKNFRMSAAGRITFWNPFATIEGGNNPHLKLNNGKTYTLKEGMKGEDALQYVTLPDDDGDMMEFIEFFMQLMQIKSGIINGADMQQSGLPAAKTATGSNIIEKSGQEMFAQFIASLEPGHRSVLLVNIRTLYKNLTEPELYRFFDGDRNMQASDILRPDDVSDLEFDVSILLTRVRTEQVLQMSAEARALVVEFYTTLPPNVQMFVAPMYRDSLKALGYDNADSIIQVMPMLPAPMPGQPGQPALGGGSPALPDKTTAEPEAPPVPTPAI